MTPEAELAVRFGVVLAICGVAGVALGVWLDRWLRGS